MGNSVILGSIRVEEFVTEARQNELIQVAQSGSPASAIRMAIREAIEAYVLGIPARAATSDEALTGHTDPERYPTAEKAMQVINEIADMVSTENDSVLYWRQGIEHQMVDISAAVKHAFLACGLKMSDYRKLDVERMDRSTGNHLWWSYYNALAMIVFDTKLWKSSKFKKYGHGDWYKFEEK